MTDNTSDDGRLHEEGEPEDRPPHAGPDSQDGGAGERDRAAEDHPHAGHGDEAAFNSADNDDADDADDDVSATAEETGETPEEPGDAGASAKPNCHAEDAEEDSPFGAGEDDESWRYDLPTVEQAKAIPLSVFTKPALRALGRLYVEDVGECLGLIRQLVAAAHDRAVTEPKLRTQVEQAARAWRKEQRDADAEAGNEGRETAADIMLRLSRNGTELFHTADGIAFVTVTQPDGRRSTMRLKSRAFATEMLARYFNATKRGATADALNTAMLNLEAAALHSGPVHQICPRVGWYGDRIYVDRGTERGDAYEIEPASRLLDGSFQPSWRLVAPPPVRFVRPEGVPVGELPDAVTGGSLADLHPFLRTENVEDAMDDGFVIAVAWVLGCYYPHGERVHMVPVGPPGAGKTTQTRFCCALADPLPQSPENSPDDPGDPGGEPEDPWSIMLAAKSSLIQSMDNVSKLTDDLHNVLCRLATGVLYRRRNYYTLTEEAAIAAKRPAIFTAVKDVVERDDLAERCVFRPIKKMDDAERSTLRDLWAAFLEKWPGILGCIFDAVSVGLANADLPKPARQPRMADFAHWVARCEPALGWPAGTIYVVLERNRLAGAESIVDTDPVAAAVRDFMAERSPGERAKLPPEPSGDTWTGWTSAGWAGSRTELLEALGKLTTPEIRRSNRWPKGANLLSGALGGVQVALQRLGVVVEASRTGQLRRIALRWAAPHPNTPAENFADAPKEERTSSSASQPSSEQEQQAKSTGFQHRSGDGPTWNGSRAASPSSQAASDAASHDDDVDAGSPPEVGPSSERRSECFENTKENHIGDGHDANDDAFVSLGEDRKNSENAASDAAVPPPPPQQPGGHNHEARKSRKRVRL